MDKHLWATGSVSWMGALRYIAHLLPLLRLLRFIINARNRCVTLVGSSLALNDCSTFIFWLISYPPYSCSRVWDEARTKSSIASCSDFDTFIARWHPICYVPHVRSGCPRRVSFSQFVFLGFPAHNLLFICAFFPFFSFHFWSLFLCGVSSTDRKSVV